MRARLARRRLLLRGVPLGSAFDALQTFLGSLYVNDFNLLGRTWQVVVQADAKFRDQAEDVQRLQLRNKDGEMVPLGSMLSVREVNGPLMLVPGSHRHVAPMPGVSDKGTSYSFRYADTLFLALDSNPHPVSGDAQ